MEFKILRQALLPSLTLIGGSIVDKRQTLPILANLLLVVKGGELVITGTNLETELVSRIALDKPFTEGEVTVPGRKLLDICKSLPAGAMISLGMKDGNVLVKSRRSRFKLSTLPTDSYPNVEGGEQLFTIETTRGELKKAIDVVAYCMADQDVRYSLNGMMVEAGKEGVALVATDGHRLAMCELEITVDIKESKQSIIPRRAVIEMVKLLDASDEAVSLSFSSYHVRMSTGSNVYISKLIDGRYPNYRAIIPSQENGTMQCNRTEIKSSISRAAILLADEKNKNIRLNITSDEVRVSSRAASRNDESEDVVEAEYDGEDLEIAFMANYLVDALGAISSDDVELTLIDASRCVVMREEVLGKQATHIVMPVRL